MSAEKPHSFVNKKIALRELRQDGIKLTIRGEIESSNPEVTIVIENDKSSVLRIRVDAKANKEIRRAIEWIKGNPPLSNSSRNIIQIRYKDKQSGFVVMREIQPYEHGGQIEEQYKIGDGAKCNYAFSSIDELEVFFANLGTITGVKLS
jgi:hypothetical protein